MTMKTIRVSERSRHDTLHVEAPGCIVNIHHGLRDGAGHPVTSVSISADGARFSGNPQWWIEGERGFSHYGVRVIQCEGRELEPAESPRNVLDALASLISPAEARAAELDRLASDCEGNAEIDAAADYREQIAEIDAALKAARAILATVVESV